MATNVGDRIEDMEGAEKLPGNWLNNRMWVRNDPDFRNRIEQIAARIHRSMSTIVRDGAEREMAFLLENHPALKDFQFLPVDEWLRVRPNKVG